MTGLVAGPTTALVIAILFEVVGTTALKATDGFTRPAPTALALACYGGAFYFLALAMRTIPVGVVYAVWSGLGIVCISLLAFVLYGQRLDAPALIGMGMIAGGVVVIQLFSKTL